MKRVKKLAKYTIELGTLLKHGFDIGLSEKDYPIFDENYRKVLNQKIIEHYYFNEIGQETAERFKFTLNRTMHEIMPYFNKLYLSEKIDISPITRYNLNESGNRKQGNKTTTTGTAQTNDKNVFSELPNGLLHQVDIDNDTYATNATLQRNDNTSNANSSAENTEDYIRTLTGNNPSKTDVEMLVEFRESLLNIDMLVIDKLSNCFMGIF